MIRFAHLFTLEFPPETEADRTTRIVAINEFNVIMRCTLTQMKSAWGYESSRFIHWCERVELTCLSAKEVLSEDEYEAFSSLLLDRNGLCRARNP